MFLYPEDCSNSQLSKILKKFLRRVQLNSFFHDKEGDSNTSDKDSYFQDALDLKIKGDFPRGPFRLFRFFINKFRQDINKLNFNRNTKFFNLSSEERVALEDRKRCFGCLAGQTLPKRIFVATFRHFFYAKVVKDLSSSNQKIVNRTINDLIVSQELPATASNIIITTSRTSCINFLSHIANLTNQVDLPSLSVVALPNSFPAI